MIKVEFTCLTCGETTIITEDDIKEKTVVPVCAVCYEKFLSRKTKLIESFGKKMKGVYKEYGIPADTFNAVEEFSELGLM